MSRLKLYLTIASLVFCGSCARQFALPRTEQATTIDSVSIELDLTPMSAQFSTLIQLTQDGTVRSVHYSRNQLKVISIQEGRISKDVQAHFSRLAHEAAFAAACNGQNFGADGLSSGDQFLLLVKSKAVTLRHCLGFSDQAPAGVRQFILELAGLQEQLSPISLADAYVRSEAVSAERMAGIRRAGQMRIVSLSAVADELQPILRHSVDRQLEFVPLSRRQYQTLQTLIAPANDFVLTADGSGSQLTLFLAHPVPSPKGDHHETRNSRIPQDEQVFPAPIVITAGLRTAEQRTRR